MTSQIRKEDVRKMVGKQIMALKKDGTVVSGKLVRISGNKLIVAPQKGKNVQVKAIIPLVLFDLLAIGTEPFGFGGFGGFPFGGGFGFGGPGFWW
ncbi:50S ribosomal protein L33 [Paenibacillus sp. Soil750]|uniref:50S ribosomal protein L33 n=1 Tax=Paenibacillus sp. Soil750 TaxID=1736398 RepID=UPI000AB8948B|nr:50S ribosomal protein L33 [Paenibacillus sp. Soil750]